MNQTMFGIRMLLCQTFLGVWSLQSLRVQRYQCLRRGVCRESIHPAVRVSVGILQPRHHLSTPGGCWEQLRVCTRGQGCPWRCPIKRRLSRDIPVRDSPYCQIVPRAAEE